MTPPRAPRTSTVRPPARRTPVPKSAPTPTASPLASLVQRARQGPAALGPNDVLALQRVAGNRATSRLLARPGTAPGDAPVQRTPARGGVPVQRVQRPALITKEAQARTLAKGKFKSAGLVPGGSAVAAEQDQTKWKTNQGKEFVPVTWKTQAIFIELAVLSFVPHNEEGSSVEEGFSMTGETVGSIGELSDTAGKGMEAFMKDDKTDHGKAMTEHLTPASQDVSMLTGVAGGLSGLIGAPLALIQIINAKDGWERLEKTGSFAGSLGTLVSSGGTLAGTGSKLAKASDKVVKTAGKAASITAAVGDILSGVKDVINSVVTAYKLYKAAKNKETTKTLGHVAELLKNLASAAANGAKAAKDIYEALAKAVPPHLLTAVPAMGIVMSTLSILMKLPKTIKGNQQRRKMKGTAKTQRAGLAALFDFPLTDKAKRDILFDKDRRGTFPAYRTYFRVKVSVREAFDKALADPKPVTALRNGLGGPLWTGLREAAKKKGVKVSTLIAGVFAAIKEYEFVDKMTEINKKREVSGWRDMILDLINIGGEIATIVAGAAMGVGAAVGQGMKGAVGAFKLTHGLSKAGQKLYRNRAQGGQHHKSTMNKHKEYVQHARFIYEQLHAATKLTDVNEKKAADAKNKQYIQATGMSYTLFTSLWSAPESQVEALVEAMKQRE